MVSGIEMLGQFSWDKVSNFVFQNQKRSENVHSKMSDLKLDRGINAKPPPSNSTQIRWVMEIAIISVLLNEMHQSPRKVLTVTEGLNQYIVAVTTS